MRDTNILLMSSSSDAISYIDIYDYQNDRIYQEYYEGIINLEIKKNNKHLITKNYSFKTELDNIIKLEYNTANDTVYILSSNRTLKEYNPITKEIKVLLQQKGIIDFT